MPAVRLLPPRPSLEYERKEAKALLRRLRAGDPDAIARARARHPGLDAIAPARARLADAQLVVAREYGFASWPRLVRYFGDVERQQHAPRQIHGGRDHLDESVRGVLAAHRAGRTWVARALAAYVPRLYGVRAHDVFASPITEEEARLAVARTSGAPSWQVLLERAAGIPQPRGWGADPHREAAAAMAAGDLEALERIVAAHPELLRPSNQDVTRQRTLIAGAVQLEQRQGVSAMRPVMVWLAGHGFDRQRELDTRLCGHIHMRVDEVRDLLERGADPTWVAPNGIPVLEHALLRYWNGEAVDVLAARTTPRKALWIAAGLGDVDGVRRFLDRDGRPTAAARRLRPDFDAAGPSPMPSPPDADDEELLLEALLVAMVNGRTAVLEYMATRGAQVNSLAYGSPLIYVAVGNGMQAAVECLVRCGADLELRGSPSDQSPRELARELFEHTPHDATRRRIVELCGMDPAVVLAERDARPAPTPTRLPAFDEALALAGDDAARHGQLVVEPENLLVGLLRAGGLTLEFLAGAGRVDLGRLREELADRLRPAADRVESHGLPISADAQAAVDAAVALATERRGGAIHGLHLLFALTRAGDGATAQLLARHWATTTALNVELEKWL
jgi:hypothetical protein